MDDPQLELQVIVTGMHLSPEFGLTYKMIEADGFKINEKIELVLSSDTHIGISKSIGLGVIGFAEAYERLKPDVIVVLGDRYEIMAAAQAALVARIPVAHLSGGEKTEGAIDDAIRHCITKMSHFHFVSAEEYRKRVIQLGEHPNSVFNFGDPGLDNIQRMKLLDKQSLEKEINFSLGDLCFLITYHPVTLGEDEQDPAQSIRELLQALDQFHTAQLIFTKPNSDAGGRKIIEALEEYSFIHKNRVALFTSMGQLRYLSALKHVDAVIGNSSSGIVEAPAFKKPTINIGDRQRGRLMADSVIHCKANREDIVNAIHIALSSPFQETLQNVKSLYGTGDTSRQIKDCLKYVQLNNITVKSFYDVPFTEELP